MLNNYGLGIGLNVKDQASNIFDRVGGKYNKMHNMFKGSAGFLPKMFGKVQTSLTNFAGKIPGVSNLLSSFGPQFAGLVSMINPVTIAIAAAVAAFVLLSKAIKESIEVASKFEYGMANISTLLDGDVKPKVAGLTKSIETMQVKYGQTSDVSP